MGADSTNLRFIGYGISPPYNLLLITYDLSRLYALCVEGGALWKLASY